MIEYSEHRYENNLAFRGVTQKATSSREELGEIATEVLIWLAGNADHLSRFLDLSGIRADQIRTHVNDREFQLGLLSFVVSHEPDLITFCAEREIAADRVARCYEKMRSEQLYKEVSLDSHLA